MKTLRRPGNFSYDTGIKRRQFLGYVAATTSAATIISACNKNDNSSSNGGIDLGSGDVGILNYAYALEQLEAAFYIQVIATKYNGMIDDELFLLTDIRNHEIAHREFLKAALGTSAIPALGVDFSTVNFSDRNSVLAVAKTFEDLGVSAYNGAGQLLRSTDYLLVAGKIVSVEARHAACISDLISGGSFADTANDGLDVVETPANVLLAAAPFLTSKLDASHLPTN